MGRERVRQREGGRERERNTHLDVLNAVLHHIALDDVSRRLVATVLTYNDGEPLLIWIVSINRKVKKNVSIRKDIFLSLNIDQPLSFNQSFTDLMSRSRLRLTVVRSQAMRRIGMIVSSALIGRGVVVRRISSSSFSVVIK